MVIGGGASPAAQPAPSEPEAFVSAEETPGLSAGSGSLGAETAPAQPTATGEEDVDMAPLHDGAIEPQGRQQPHASPSGSSSAVAAGVQADAAGLARLRELAEKDATLADDPSALAALDRLVAALPGDLTAANLAIMDENYTTVQGLWEIAYGLLNRDQRNAYDAAVAALPGTAGEE